MKKKSNTAIIKAVLATLLIILIVSVTGLYLSLKNLSEKTDETFKKIDQQLSEVYLRIENSEKRIDLLEKNLKALSVEVAKKLKIQSRELSSADILRVNDVSLYKTFADGRAAFNRQEYAKAKNCFIDLISIDPPVWDARLYYAWSSYYENPTKASSDSTLITMIENIPKEYNKNGSVSKLKGLLSLEARNYGKAEAYLNEALLLNPNDKECIEAKKSIEMLKVQQ